MQSCTSKKVKEIYRDQHERKRVLMSTAMADGQRGSGDPLIPSVCISFPELS